MLDGLPLTDNISPGQGTEVEADDLESISIYTAGIPANTDITWMVNNDREFLQGGATQATQVGLNSFPYEAPPNKQLQTVVNSIGLSASAEQVWDVIGQFGGTWHLQVIGEGVVSCAVSS